MCVSEREQVSPPDEWEVYEEDLSDGATVEDDAIEDWDPVERESEIRTPEDPELALKLYLAMLTALTVLALGGTGALALFAIGGPATLPILVAIGSGWTKKSVYRSFSRPAHTRGSKRSWKKRKPSRA